MFANRFTVVTDACVLVPPLTRNLLLSLAEAHLFRVRWSARILDEFERGFVRDVLRSDHPDPLAAARRARATMEAAFPEAMICGGASFPPAPRRTSTVSCNGETVVSFILRRQRPIFPPGISRGLSVSEYLLVRQQ